MILYFLKQLFYLLIMLFSSVLHTSLLLTTMMMMLLLCFEVVLRYFYWKMCLKHFVERSMIELVVVYEYRLFLYNVKELKHHHHRTNDRYLLNDFHYHHRRESIWNYFRYFENPENLKE